MIDILSEINGVSGAECKVSEYIKEMLDGVGFDITEDGMGNLFVCSEKVENASTVVLSAHMDEAGFIITAVTDDGYLKFDTIGEIPAASLLSKRVSVEGVPGIISAKAVHLLSKEERNTPVKIEDLFIDIGAASYADAISCVKPGDYCSFDNDFYRLGDDYISNKALSGRSGCEILLDILKNIDTKNINITAIFTTQKNVSSRGMKTALHSIKYADLAIVFDCVEVHKKELFEYDIMVSLPSISTDPRCSEYAKKLISAAECCGIKCKIEAADCKTDADIFTNERPYIPAIIAAVPCLNKNTPSEIIKQRSISAAVKGVLKLTEGLKNGIL